MIKVRRIESVEDIVVTHEGEYFSITWDKILNVFKVGRLKEVAPRFTKSKDTKAESKQADKPRESKVGMEENTNQGELPVKRPMKATDTAIVARTPTLCIRQGPLDDILMLEDVNGNTVSPILRMWYSHAAESTIQEYTLVYLRFLRGANYIDGEGHVLKIGEQTEDEGIPEKEKPWKSNGVGQPMYDEVAEEGKVDDEGEEEDEGPYIPAPEDLTVVTTRDDIVIYLEPLNEILQLNVVNDAALEQVLSHYYEAPRPAIMFVIKRAWKRFLSDRKFLDKTGKPIIEKVTLQFFGGR